MSNCVVLILAGGASVRMNSDIPKQYMKLAGKSVLRRTIEAFLGHPALGSVRVVAGVGHQQHYEAGTASLRLPPPITGGTTRQRSARAGLEALADDPPEHVLIHDAARPFVDLRTIERVLSALRHGPAVVPALPVTETLKRAHADSMRVKETLNRAGVWSAQTPQGFDFQRILAAHRQFAHMDLTDDAAVAEMAGLEVSLVEGMQENFKISNPDDFARAERMLAAANSEYRVGTGFDVHAFGEGSSVTLGGVAIPHDRGLEGHSDADVVLHAITDALLGAIGAGDIGYHFPPSDDRWLNASSRIFAEHAVRLIRGKGGVITNVDATIVCSSPRIGPHRASMVQRLSEILVLDPERISIKATTTEGLGFTGRKEGIAAQACATVRIA